MISTRLYLARLRREQEAADELGTVPTLVRVVTMDGVDEFRADWPDQFMARGYVVTGTFHRAGARPELVGHPVLEGFCGPMWDGDAIRYESVAFHAAMTEGD